MEAVIVGLIILFVAATVFVLNRRGKDRPSSGSSGRNKDLGDAQKK